MKKYCDLNFKILIDYDEIKPENNKLNLTIILIVLNSSIDKYNTFWKDSTFFNININSENQKNNKFIS